MRSLVMVMFLALCACSGVGASGGLVGGECSTDKDCDEICTTEEDFGRGMCTKRCATDNDCPDGALCVDKDNGICAVACSSNEDCEDFGRGFACDEMKRKSGGETRVCRLP